MADPGGSNTPPPSRGDDTIAGAMPFCRCGWALPASVRLIHRNALPADVQIAFDCPECSAKCSSTYTLTR